MQVIKDAKLYVNRIKGQDFGFYAAAAYLTFEFLRPHVIYPFFDVIPWARISILLGFFYVLLKGNLRIQTIHVLLLAFLGSVYISSVLSYVPNTSFNMIDTMISWVVVVMFFSNAIRTLEQYKLLIILFFLYIFKISFFGARTWAGRGFAFTDWGISGPQGFFQNSGELSLLMVVFAAMSFGYIIGHKDKGLSKLYYLVPITAAMTVLGASSRGSQLALALMVILYAVRMGKLSLKNVALVAVVGWIGFTLLPDEQKERFSTMGEDGTSESRLVYWEKGLEMMSNNPWFGIGHYAFPSYFEDRYAHSVEFEQFTYRREVAHNTFIQVGSEQGYVGLSIYLLLVWMCFRLTKKTRQLIKGKEGNEHFSWIPNYTIGVDMAMVGYLIGSFFMSVAFYPYLYVFLMFNQALYNTTKKRLAQTEGQPSTARAYDGKLQGTGQAS